MIDLIQNKTLKYVLYVVWWIVLIAWAMWQKGYNPFAGSGDIGTVVTLEQLQEMQKDVNNDKKRVAVIGTTYVPWDITISPLEANYLMIRSSEGKSIVGLPLYFGEWKNNFFLPDTFGDEDLAIYDNNGTKHAYNENVQFSFTMHLQDRAGDPGENSWLYDQVRIDPVSTIK